LKIWPILSPLMSLMVLLATSEFIDNHFNALFVNKPLVI